MLLRTLALQLALVVLMRNGVDTAAIKKNQVQKDVRNAWSYDDPSLWPDTFPMCGGESQSPINLDPLTATGFAYPNLSFTNYDKVFVEALTNNGHTIVLQMPEVQVVDDRPYVTGGGLPGTYIFEQLHFHWGSDVSRGSEHRISDQTFPAELHIVHYNKAYGDFNSALAYSDGIAVIGIMIELEARDNIAFRHIQHFENIVNANAAPSAITLPIPLEDLLPDDIGTFFRYDGSLTTPECNEAVIWTVFETPIAVSERQLNHFKEVNDAELLPMENNYRPIQPLNTRVVTYRKATP